jgi:hypothetical protein
MCFGFCCVTREEQLDGVIVSCIGMECFKLLSWSKFLLGFAFHFLLDHCVLLYYICYLISRQTLPFITVIKVVFTKARAVLVP